MVIYSIGLQFDKLHDIVNKDCPLGNIDDPPEIYNSSARYLANIIADGNAKFQVALNLMVQDTPEGKAELERFGFETVQEAKDVAFTLSNTVASESNVPETFEPWKAEIEEQPGYRYPLGTPPNTNLMNLAYSIYSAHVDLENDLIQIPAREKQIFIDKWSNIWEEINTYSSWASRVRKWAQDFLDTPAATQLLTDWKDPGRIGYGNTHVQSQLSFQILFLRYYFWFDCWSRGLKNVIGWTTNTLGPLPYPGPPTFYSKDPRDHKDIMAEIKSAKLKLEEDQNMLLAQHAALRAAFLVTRQEHERLQTELAAVRTAVSQWEQQIPQNPVPLPVVAPMRTERPRGRMKPKRIPETWNNVAVAVAVPFSNWLDYIQHEFQVLSHTAKIIDQVKDLRKNRCPIGGQGDNVINPANYHRSLSYIVDALTYALDSFDSSRWYTRQRLLATCPERVPRIYKSARGPGFQEPGWKGRYSKSWKEGGHPDMANQDVGTVLPQDPQNPELESKIQEEPEQSSESSVSDDNNSDDGNAYVPRPPYDPETQLELTRWSCSEMEDLETIAELLSNIVNTATHAQRDWLSIGAVVDRLIGLYSGSSNPSSNVGALGAQIERAKFQYAEPQSQNARPTTVVYQSNGRHDFVRYWLGVARRAQVESSHTRILILDVEDWMDNPAFDELVADWDFTGNGNLRFIELFKMLVKWFNCWGLASFHLADAVSNILGPPPGPLGATWEQKIPYEYHGEPPLSWSRPPFAVGRNGQANLRASMNIIQATNQNQVLPEQSENQIETENEGEGPGDN
ncbi:hypothetical protein H072_11499 [Dactylellina haptotyla CBS 200.50]|uniref:Uncharacterized protein n=1 Tax=Dactylellina haptotyla (strain CBS 200.50) TaxID=1284197 RepID=S8A208_DACHA|nr:hypothetical protein H072_11499 [Dactylellina haptotyla CBS 200.50]